jgi:photosystem II stability/assembly factor-like uncharacterized protein
MGSFFAVAASNDYVGDGDWIGNTSDGGQTWASTFKDPKTSVGTRCFGGDPSVVYSVRDGAFYLATLCFFGAGESEVQVWRSTDDGATWMDSTKASLVNQPHRRRLGRDGLLRQGAARG